MRNNLILILYFIFCANEPHAAEQKLWQYPCDVFLSSACFRLPSGMSVVYEVPADFGIYRINRSGSVLATIYHGSAPRKIRADGRASFRLSSQSHVLEAFASREGSESRVDLFITPKQGSPSLIHLFSRFSGEQKESVSRLVAGLRPCRKPYAGTFDCPTESLWGQELSKWILSIDTSAE